MNPIKKARENAGLSYRKAASQLGIGLTTLQRWEAPDFRPKTLPLETLEAMAALYQVSIPQLIGRAPLPNHDPAA